MKNRKTWQIIIFVVMCVGLNLGGKFFTAWLQLPLWADSFGTALGAYVMGPVCGAIIGVTGNLAYCVVNHLSAVYSMTSIAIGLIIGIGARRHWFDQFYGFMKAASLAVVTALVVSVPLNFMFTSGYTGDIWGDGVIEYLSDKGVPFVLCCILGQLALEFVDKVLTIAAVYLAILLQRAGRGKKRMQAQKAGAVGTAMILCLAFGLSSFTMSIKAAGAGESSGEGAAPTSGYNDYVQSVYSSNNGLPCGEANAIVQTNDGVLWIGTYAGLYRYNGREFRWIDNYESVKNVNCLYVDEEGRLWIGTNDNGLSIVIREEVVNVLNQDSGLPSDSVRSIVRSSDGYYYIGTTSSMQVLVMNNGLKAVDTFEDIHYADSITADNNGHVAAVTNDGELFLITNGVIKGALTRPEGDDQFNCCTFAPDGTLMVGSSTNKIYNYDISDDAFKAYPARDCSGVEGINNLTYLDDGTMFISTDTGVAFVDGNGYHVLNTNDFDNSIDSMLHDYQGNLWFTSSRLGLLRLAKSPFRDIYGSIGMERDVVNTIVYWQNCYYIGTDDGLDAVDKTCHRQVENALTKELEGRRIRCMYVDENDHIWICTYGSGLIEYSPKEEKWAYNSENGSFGNKARIVGGLSDGTIIAAGDTGISYIRDHKVVNTIRHEDGLTNATILTLKELKDGTILAGTDGDGIAVIKDGKVTDCLTRDNGLSSEVILRMVKDPKTEGMFVVTSNSLCYMEPDGSIRVLDKFPYFNNYDIWVKDEDTLFVMSSAGI